MPKDVLRGFAVVDDGLDSLGNTFRIRRFSPGLQCQTENMHMN